MADNIPLDHWSGSGATKALHDAIDKYQQENSRQTSRLIFLTWVIAGLTVIMLLEVAFQIYLQIYPIVVE